ncbi:hypothetical protein [Corynebacterium timonense]|uniref:Uncharacterized protein n=1 Tax=Corynebacterium timonense TaxID=441500 RepID=A0A1H1S2X2_9CORY|nr:hypothetical protein [Corynebacterium timonense]SDS42223.1 hypothetical protein SAMN04488539_1644 [Corynebacterium timonense]
MNISTLRTTVTVVSAIVMIALITLVFATPFPWWAGLIVAVVILIPMQIYLNRSKPQQKDSRNDY